MAHVIVQHLAPNHESIMAEILSRSTGMTLHTASDGMMIEPNQIYVNPPNADLTISDGRLHLTTPQAHVAILTFRPLEPGAKDGD